MPTPACRADGLGSFGALLAIALAALPGLPQAQPLPPAWEAREVFAPAGTQWTDVGDFNRHGAFVGMVRGDGVYPMGVLADPFGATQLLAPLAGDTHTERLVLNDVGEVAGVSRGEYGQERAFHRSSTGVMSQLAIPEGGIMSARGVNNRGEVLFVNGSRGYVHDTRTGQIRSVGEALPIGAGSVGAYHINNRGVVSTLTVPSWIEGQEVPPTRGYLDDHGQLRFLGYGVSAIVLTDRGDVALSNGTVLLADDTRYTYDHGVGSRFIDMNERGQVVGFDHPSDPFCLSSRGGCGRAFLFEEGQTTFLDASFASQGHLPVGSRAIDINEQGQVLAMAWFAAGDRVTRVFLWSEGQVVDLTEQMASLTGLSRDYSISEASLNDAGQVLFRMTRAYNDPDLVFVLSPVPEPQVMAMLAAGLLVVGGLSRRRARASHWSND
jgi:uncharacterized membrane protein